MFQMFFFLFFFYKLVIFSSKGDLNILKVTIKMFTLLHTTKGINKIIQENRFHLHKIILLKNNIRQQNSKLIIMRNVS